MPNLTLAGINRDLISQRLFFSQSGLILYAPLWKRDGSVLVTDDAYGYLATVTGAIWVSQGRTFDGNDFLSIPSSSPLNPGSITIAAWVYPTTESAAAQYAVVTKGNSAAFTGYYMSWKNGAADYKFNFGWGDGVAWRFKETSSSYTTLNRWYYLVNTFDQTTWSIYVDCVLDGSGTQAGVIQSNSLNLNIGRDVSAATWYWKGTIGDVLIYNRALSAAEILRNYQTTKWRYV